MAETPNPGKLYRVRWNFDRAQPHWARLHSDTFGKQNQGVAIVAQDAKTAVKLFAAQHNFNPFYLMATEG